MQQTQALEEEFDLDLAEECFVHAKDMGNFF
jgi:hypothetical protein